ncbi:TRAP transporter small permease [Phytopseudomonas punonensis]|uniref:TRAP transporter small permease protein n=1 Tax=Phytopseudomonas punonensis TaxID=1220495 RepID=A0A1M6XL11_9GAMM|nr:TRAP transporter small permease [Pseudomonas punonensis]SHL06539.1 TRAP-type C4-dicarboxylate transport system, small permease component [Pseudomonas punonensis]
MRLLTLLMSRLFESIVVFCMGTMVILVFFNVVLRYGFNSGIALSDEGARYLFVWLTFIGAVVALRDNAHLGVDLLYRRLPAFGQRICAVVAELMMLFCVSLFLIGSYKQTVINMDNLSPVANLPLGLMYAAGVVCSLGMAAIMIKRLYLLLFCHVDPDKVMPQSPEDALISEVSK